MRTLVTAWGWLVAASALTTALAGVGPDWHGGIWLAPVLLGLAFFKARIILARYLDLAQAPRILSGFTLALALWFALALALVMAA